MTHAGGNNHFHFALKLGSHLRNLLHKWSILFMQNYVFMVSMVELMRNYAANYVILQQMTNRLKMTLN